MQPGTILCGKYEIKETIGHGGMSTVYRAVDQLTGRVLAVKDVECQGAEESMVVRRSLAVEARLLTRLNNEHLPRIYDIIEDEKSFMLVMDLIEGVSLDRYLAKNGACPPAQAISWGIQVCEVFNYLHKQMPPVIYRDMKPANLILQPDGKLMMIDFGTAREYKNSEMTQDTTCLGTCGFAAPEQFGGMGESDARTDIFCLGATLYNIATGHSPYEPPTGIWPLSKWNPALENHPLNDIIQKCTRPDPLQRYQNANELRTDLEAALKGSYQSVKKGKNSANPASPEKSVWQQQKLHQGRGTTGGISGLLKRENKKVQPETQAQNWKKPTAVAQLPQQQGMWNAANSEPIAQPEDQQTGVSVWKRILLIAAIASAVFFIFGAVTMLLNGVLLATVLLIAGSGAIVLMLVSAVAFLREQRLQ